MDVRVTDGVGYVSVSAHGLLSVRTAPQLRDTLLKASAEQPQGLVCDLTGARATREGLTVLHVVADRVADWPSSPMALVASSPAQLHQLELLGLRRRLPVVPDLEHVLTALRRSPRLLRAATDLPPTVDAPAVARAFVGAALQRWRASDAVEAARWIASELVTNAVVHAGTDLTVRVSLTGPRAALSVADRGRAGAVPTEDGRGYGLRVVDRLSRRWGVLPRLAGGTVVWAVLDVDLTRVAGLPQQADRRP